MKTWVILLAIGFVVNVAASDPIAPPAAQLFPPGAEKSLPAATGERMVLGTCFFGGVRPFHGWITSRGGAATGFDEKDWITLNAPYTNSHHLALGDVDGDGLDEVVAGFSSGGYVQITHDFSTETHKHDWIYLPWPTYSHVNGEIWPAVGDIDNDGLAEIVLGLGRHGEGWFAIYDDKLAGYALLAWRQVRWPAYNTANGATFPAVADVDGIPGAEIIIGLGTGGYGWIEVFSNAASNYSHLTWLQIPWPAYNAANGETHVAAGDLDGDGRAEIVAGLGAGGAGWMHIFDDAAAGYAPLRWRQLTWPSYNDDPLRGHTFPAVGDVDDGDAAAEIVVGLWKYFQNGGWFEVIDDYPAGLTTLAWRNVGFPQLTKDGGGLCPAIGRVR